MGRYVAWIRARKYEAYKIKTNSLLIVPCLHRLLSRQNYQDYYRHNLLSTFPSSFSSSTSTRTFLSRKKLTATQLSSITTHKIEIEDTQLATRNCTYNSLGIYKTRTIHNTFRAMAPSLLDPAISETYPGPDTTFPAVISKPSQSHPVLPTFSLQGRTIIVTGGARGLGLVMAKALVLSGANVALVDLNDEEAASQIALLREAYRLAHPEVASEKSVPRVTAHRADVSSEESVAACVQAVHLAHFPLGEGVVDGLVTSAGFTENFPATEYPIERVRRLWSVNVDGTYLFATAVAREMMRHGRSGSMVFIGSMSGAIVNVPQPQAPYNASKAAVRHLCASLAVEWAPHSIRVNTISPGYMATALTEKILAENPSLKDKWVGGTPQQRMGDPEDLMGPVTFLLSDASRYVTGADLRVDGGYTIV